MRRPKQPPSKLHSAAVAAALTAKEAQQSGSSWEYVNEQKQKSREYLLSLTSTVNDCKNFLSQNQALTAEAVTLVKAVTISIEIASQEWRSTAESHQGRQGFAKTPQENAEILAAAGNYISCVEQLLNEHSLSVSRLAEMVNTISLENGGVSDVISDPATDPSVVTDVAFKEVPKSH